MRIILSALWGWNLGLVLCFVLLAIGCSQVEKPSSLDGLLPLNTSTPAPIPTPTMSVSVVSTLQKKADERVIITDLLTRYNNAGNHYIQFLQATGEIYGLHGSMLAPEESRFHINYVASKLTLYALMVYGDAIRNWSLPEDSIYYDELMEIKEAELYRIQYFGDLTEMMLTALPTENAETVSAVHDQFVLWRDNPLNLKPMTLQYTLLTELGISTEDVNFLYEIPEKPLPTLPPIFNIEKDSTVG